MTDQPPAQPKNEHAMRNVCPLCGMPFFQHLHNCGLRSPYPAPTPMKAQA